MASGKRGPVAGEMLQGTLDMLILRTLVMGRRTAHDRTGDRAYVGECAGSGAGFALSGATSAGGSRIGVGEVGREREQSQGQVLSVDGCGKTEAGGGDEPVAADDAGDRVDSG